MMAIRMHILPLSDFMVMELDVHFMKDTWILMKTNTPQHFGMKLLITKSTGYFGANNYHAMILSHTKY